MASNIRVHQDIFKIVRRHGGLAFRQWACLVAGAIVVLVAANVLYRALGLDIRAAITVGLILAMPFVLAGFVPLFHMPFEAAAIQMFENYLSPVELTAKGESVQIEKGELSREYIRQSRKKGFDARGGLAGEHAARRAAVQSKRAVRR